MQGGENPAEGHRWIDHGAPVRSRMKVARRAHDPDLEVGEAPEGKEECGQTRREHPRVGNHHRVTGQPLFLGLNEGHEIRRADLLFTLGQNDQIDRKGPILPFKWASASLDVEVELPFVIRRASGVEASVAKLWLKGR